MSIFSGNFVTGTGLVIVNLPSFYRLRRIRVPGIVYDGDVDQDVRLGATDIFRVVVQSVRLCRHQRVHLRGGVVRGEGWLVRFVRAASLEVT